MVVLDDVTIRVDDGHGALLAVFDFNCSKPAAAPGRTPAGDGCHSIAILRAMIELPTAAPRRRTDPRGSDHMNESMNANGTYTRADWSDFDRTGPGTLAGRYLRLFWQPVFMGADLPAGWAKPIRIMSEDFTL